MQKIFNINNQEFVEIPLPDTNITLETSKPYNFMAFNTALTTVQSLFLSSPYLYKNRIYMNNPKKSSSGTNSINIDNNITFTIREEMDDSKLLTTTYSVKGSLDYGQSAETVMRTDYAYPRLQFIETRVIPLAFTYNSTIIAAGICVITFMQFPTYMQYRTDIRFNNKMFTGTVYNTDYHGIIIKNTELEYRSADITEDTGVAGGYGKGEMPTDNINIPNLPNISFNTTGALLYILTESQMNEFRSWLWSSDWQDNIKKIRTDPMQNIIGISIVDIDNIISGSANIFVGNVNSKITAGIVSNNFAAVDCGEITLDEYYGTFADYEPFIATTLYLPKVGFVQIPADVCVNNTIKVVYHIELSSGEGLCYVQLTSKRDGFTYIWNTYTCHITSNVVLSAQDHTQQLIALGNAIINTSAATAGAISSPSSAPQALNTVLSSCFDVATTKNPTQTRGNIGNMSAIMCYKKPYLLINRTNLTKPSSFQDNNGYLINYTAKINEHTGFLKTKDFHAEFNAPYNHKVEIERLMNEGVFING